jgi:hypothetical protein
MGLAGVAFITSQPNVTPHGSPISAQRALALATVDRSKAVRSAREERPDATSLSTTREEIWSVRS